MSLDSQETPYNANQSDGPANPSQPGIQGFLQRNRVQWTKRKVQTVQINMGKLCNQVCLHCHVDAGPNKKAENMQEKVFDRIVHLIDQSPEIKTLDLTGGAPELNPYFRDLVLEARNRKIQVMDRCNLTVLWEKGQETTAEFLAENQVKVVASLPCYSADNVNKQRGDGVFDKSIRALQLLNSLGYGRDPQLEVDLVYNPIGPDLPGDQITLQTQYKKMLKDNFGIDFNSLYCITNMPIKRFLFDLKRQNKYNDYMELLVSSFNAAAAENVMCLDMVSVNWDGTLSDCDFNQMLSMKVNSPKQSIWEVSSFEDLRGIDIKTASHCFGCTAGAGSSCGGSLTEET